MNMGICVNWQKKKLGKELSAKDRWGRAVGFEPLRTAEHETVNELEKNQEPFVA